MPEGLVIQHGANRYIVELDPPATGEQPQLWACSLRGKLRQGRREHVRLVVVGDRVRVSADPAQGQSVGVVEEVLPRRNKISRPQPSGGSRKILEQVVIANLDRIWVIAALAQPAPGLTFVDRILAAAQHQEVAAGLILNKADLPEAADPEPLVALYESLGYPVRVCSAVSGQGVEEILQEMNGRISAFVGLSGVGKSSLLAAIQPGLDLRVKTVAEKTGQGRHTTTGSRLYPLDAGGYVADTPGMREFGLWGMVRRELGSCFVEMQPLSAQCRFRDCLHLAEPSCAVRDALEAGELDPGRYARYRALLEELPDALDRPEDRRRGGPRPPR